MKNNIFTMTLTLVIIAIVVSIAMSYVNNITAPIIAKNDADKLNKSLEQVIDAKNFEAVEENENYTIYKAVKNGEVVGFCVKNTSSGYGGDITLLTGIDKDFNVTGVEILNHGETAGLGANATKPEYKNQYKGKSDGMTVVKNSPKENDIVAISGATITSKAVTEGVNTAISLVKEAGINE